MTAPIPVHPALQRLVDAQRALEHLGSVGVSDDDFWWDYFLLKEVSTSHEWRIIESKKHQEKEATVKLALAFDRALTSYPLRNWIDTVIQGNDFLNARRALHSVTEVRKVQVTINSRRPSDDIARVWYETIKQKVASESLLHNSVFVIDFIFVRPDDPTMDALRIETINYLLR